MSIHVLRVKEEDLANIINGIKTFEVRRNVPEFKVGDTVALWGYDKDAGSYTGHAACASISYVVPLRLRGWSVVSDYCIMSLSLVGHGRFSDFVGVKILDPHVAAEQLALNPSEVVTEQFDYNRIAFIYIDGTIWVQYGEDTRPCEEWARTVYGIDHDMWASATRGYMLPDRVQFFTGENYGADHRVGFGHIMEAADVHRGLYKDVEHFDFYNGLVPGVRGLMWEPQEIWNPGCGWEAV